MIPNYVDSALRGFQGRLLHPKAFVLLMIEILRGLGFSEFREFRGLGSREFREFRVEGLGIRV